MNNDKWEVMSMSNLFDVLNPNENRTFPKPNFPTKRWGQIYRKFSTSDIISINKALPILKAKGIKCRKRIDHESNKKFKQYKFYRIEIKTK